MVYQNLTPGLLPSEAERLGKITVGTELGWGRAVQSGGRALRAGRACWPRPSVTGNCAATSSRLRHHRAGTQVKAAMVDRECFTVAPFAGHYESLIDCGRAVRRGEVVGLLHDFDHIDMPPWPAVAGVDGVIIAQAWAAPVMRGQHIVVVGRILA